MSRAPIRVVVPICSRELPAPIRTDPTEVGIIFSVIKEGALERLI